jgi:hypothetical protein
MPDAGLPSLAPSSDPIEVRYWRHRHLAWRHRHWSSVYTRFRDWVKADVWKRLFEAVPDASDMEYAMIDATIVKVHRHGQARRRGNNRFELPCNLRGLWRITARRAPTKRSQL